LQDLTSLEVEKKFAQDTKRRAREAERARKVMDARFTSLTRILSVYYKSHDQAFKREPPTPPPPIL
jgi:hypothetical protein